MIYLICYFIGFVLTTIITGILIGKSVLPDINDEIDTIGAGIFIIFWPMSILVMLIFVIIYIPVFFVIKIKDKF